MKKMMVTIGLVLTVAAAYSQNYWVVETDKTGRSIVKVYNSQNILVKESTVERRIDITKKKSRRMLDKIVKQQSDLLWSKR